MASGKIKLTLKHGLTNLNERQIATVKGLGLKKIGQTVVVLDNNPTRGMVRKVIHLLQVEKA